HAQLAFLYTIGNSLDELPSEYTGLFNMGLHRHISFLDRPAAIALVTAPVKDVYTVEQGAIDAILRLTSGHPYFTQLLCHSLFNLAQQRHLISVKADH